MLTTKMGPEDGMKKVLASCMQPFLPVSDGVLNDPVPSLQSTFAETLSEQIPFVSSFTAQSRLTMATTTMEEVLTWQREGKISTIAEEEDPIEDLLREAELRKASIGDHISLRSSLRRSGTRRTKSAEVAALNASSGSFSLEDLPQDAPVETRRRRRKERADARLHSSMSSLDGISPEDLKMEVDRRRKERSDNMRAGKQAIVLPVSNSAALHSSLPTLSVALAADEAETLARTSETEAGSTDGQGGGLSNYVKISTRDNSDYIWQAGVDVYGALEVSSVLEFDFRAPLVARYVPDREPEFDRFLQVWEELKLKDEFVQACANIPLRTSCFGMVRNDDRTIKEMCKNLSIGWIKTTNQRLKARRELLRLDAFVWSWHNATGKAKTNIMLIRFLNNRRRSMDA
jgi:hypothetical protein